MHRTGDQSQRAARGMHPEPVETASSRAFFVPFTLSTCSNTTALHMATQSTESVGTRTREGDCMKKSLCMMFAGLLFSAMPAFGAIYVNLERPGQRNECQRSDDHFAAGLSAISQEPPSRSRCASTGKPPRPRVLCCGPRQDVMDMHTRRRRSIAASSCCTTTACCPRASTP